MKACRAPALVLGLLYLCFLGYLAASSACLPGRVATHFDVQGQPDGWMSRTAYLRSMLVFGLAFPLLIPAIVYVSRFLPDRFYNLPHRDHWLAPERRPETMTYLLRQALWFSSMALCFVAGIHALTVHANSSGPAQLSTPLMLALAGGFLAGTVVWVVSMLRHFNRVA